MFKKGNEQADLGELYFWVTTTIVNTQPSHEILIATELPMGLRTDEQPHWIEAKLHLVQHPASHRVNQMFLGSRTSRARSRPPLLQTCTN